MRESEIGTDHDTEVEQSLSRTEMRKDENITHVDEHSSVTGTQISEHRSVVEEGKVGPGKDRISSFREI